MKIEKFKKEISKYKWMTPVDGGAAAVKGFKAGGIYCGLKDNGALDLSVFISDRPCNTAAFYTTNKLLGAHIPVFKDKLKKTGGKSKVLLVNSRNANCATGEKGEADNRALSDALGKILDVPGDEVLFASTGVIGKLLPVPKIRGSLKKLVAEAGETPETGDAAARGIMTTDTRPKMCAVRVKEGDSEYVIGGVAKGSGMICPNMATMFSFIFTDADVPVSALKKSAADCVNRTYNMISVDGDTSPNDTVMVMANGASGVKIKGKDVSERFNTALYEVARYLCMEIIRDGEGATKLVHLEITGAKNDGDAEKMAREIANSQLVKTAIFGMDPNWGRIVSAAGISGADFDPMKAKLKIDGNFVYNCGKIVKPRKKLMAERDVFINLDAGLGAGSARFWTCDLSYGYVKINAEYTT